MCLQNILINAFTIWSFHPSYGAHSVREIEEFTGDDEEFIFLALGYLAKENKNTPYRKARTPSAESGQCNYSEIYF